MPNKIDVIIGIPICKRTSYVLDKLLANQQEIQRAYPGCILVFAIDEADFVAELKEQISHYQLHVDVIRYRTIKPQYAQSRIWSVTCGREALRQYVLSKGAEYFLSLDGDMVFESSIVSNLKARCNGFDVVVSGYIMPPRGCWGFGNGCLLLHKRVLSKMAFRCYEFNNGQIIDESETMDWGLYKCHARVKKGIFIAIKHYIDQEKYYSIDPKPLGWFRRLTNNLTIRFIFTQICILTKYNIARKLQAIAYKSIKTIK